jgi:hypothetical protein
MRAAVANDRRAPRALEWTTLPSAIRLIVNDPGNRPSFTCMILGGTSGPDAAAYRAAFQAVKALAGTNRAESVSREFNRALLLTA